MSSAQRLKEKMRLEFWRNRALALENQIKKAHEVLDRTGVRKLQSRTVYPMTVASRIKLLRGTLVR